MTILLRAVPTLEIPKVWEKASAVLVPALERWAGRHDEASLFAALCTDDFQLWIAEEDGEIRTACLTQIVTWPLSKECHVFGVAGDGYDLWGEWIEVIKAWAISIGCQRVTCRGRKGWERVLGPAGFRHDGICLTVEI